MNDIFGSFCDEIAVAYERNVDLKSKTWIHRGGLANFYVTPINIIELQEICRFLYEHERFFEIVGCTSNLYFLNGYNPDIVLSTIKIKNYEIINDELVCDCGVLISHLSKEMVRLGVKGFEGLIDLPGTVASAVYNNSGCFGCSVSSMLIKVDFMYENGVVDTLSPNDFEYTFRSSTLKRKELKGIILRVYLKMIYGDVKDIVLKAELNHKIRISTQERPVHNLGSCFNSLRRNGLLLNVLRCIGFGYRCLAKILKHNDERKESVLRKIYFSLIGYSFLLPYVSLKSMNCFVWKDNNADKMFLKYKEYMRKVYKTEQLEIEIKK